MKKLMLFLVAAMLGLVAANAQTGTFVVANGTESNDEVPINTNYADFFLRCQTIYPESMLASIVGKEIQGITYYLSQPADEPTNGTFEIKIGTCTSASFDDEEWLDASSLASVYTGELDCTRETLIINFSTPFTYTGGNLVIEVSETSVSENYGYSYFLGIELEGATLVGSDYEDYAAIEPSISDFLPKTGFIVPVSCAAPTISSVTADAYSATVAWTENGSATAWQYKLDGTAWTDITTPSPYTITGLAQNTEYALQLRSVCGVDNESFASVTSFTTDIACAQVVDARVTHSSQTAVAVEWTINNLVGGASTEVEVSYKEAGATDWITATATNNNYIFTGLTEGTSYNIRITNICGTDTASAVTLNVTTPICGEVTGSDSSDYLPVYNYYKYSYTQFIYTANETGSYGSFDNISFYHKGASNFTRTIDVYIADIEGASLSNGFIDIAQFTQVASDYEWNVSHGWNSIPLSSAFEHTAGKDIVVAINDKTGSYVSGYGINRSFACHSGSGAYLYNDNNAYNPENPGTANNSDLVPNIRFNTTCNPSCTAPIVVFDNATTNSITVSWSPLGDETSWSAEYRLAGESEWSNADNNVTANSYTFSNLAPSSYYAIRIGANCGGQTAYATLNAATECDVVSVTVNNSYEQSFDNITSGIPMCWNQDAENTNQWGSLSDAFSGRGMVFSGDDGSSADLITPGFDFSALSNGAQIRFQYELPEQEDWWSGDTYMASIDILYRTSNSGEWIAVPNASITSPAEEWTEYELVLPSSVNAAFYQVAVRATGDDEYYTYAYIDEFVVEAAPTCLRPAGFDAVTTENSATLTWTSDANQFEVRYSIDGTDWTSTTVNATTATITGLSAATVYQFQVRAVCTVGDTSTWASVTAATTCEVVSVTVDESYVQTFDDITSGIPMCWEQEPSSTSEWISSASGYSERCLSFSDYNGNSSMLISPVFNFSSLNNGAQVSFWYKNTSGYNGTMTASVYYRTSADGEWVVLPEGEIDAEHTDWTEFSAILPNSVNGGFYQIAVDAEGEYDYYYMYMYIDEFVVEAAPTCIRPSDFVVATTDTEATLTWTSDATQFEVQYSTDGTNWTPSTVNASTTTVTGLNSSTAYQFRVRAICSVGDTSSWATTTARTACDVVAAADMPYFQGFEGDANCWNQEFVSGNIEWQIDADITDENYTQISAYEGSSYMGILNQDSENPDITRLVSPIFDLSSFETATLKFAHQQAEWGDDQDKLTVEYRLGPTSEWQTLATYTNDIPTWRSETFQLTTLSSQFQIAFKATCSFGRGIAIDSISLSAEGQAVPTCDIPTNVTTLNLTANTVTVTWNGTAPQYEIEISGGTQTITETVSANTFSTEALTPETPYTVKVRALCDTDLTSDWSAVSSFTTTQPECGVPVNVQTTTTSTTVTVTWTGYAAEYEVIVSGGDMPITRTGITNNSCTIEGLTPASTYNVKVRAICDGQYTDWTEPLTFYTADGSGISEVNGNYTVSLFPNPTNGKFALRIDGESGKVDVSLIDMNGRVIITDTANSNDTVHFNITSLSKGTYFVRLSGEKTNIVRKLIVQ